MRFLVLSDIHGRAIVAKWANRLAEENGVDAIIVLGDIVHFSPADWAEEFLSDLKYPVYAVPGNCDPPATMEYIKKKASLLHLSKVRLDGVTYIGFGGSNPTIFETPFEMDESEIREKLEPLMEKDAIMVLHCPPRGKNDSIMGGKHVGSTAIEGLVKAYRPRAVLSGHIHEDRGAFEEDGIFYMNPGAAKDGFAAVFEVGEKVQGGLLEKVTEQG